MPLRDTGSMILGVFKTKTNNYMFRRSAGFRKALRPSFGWMVATMGRKKMASLAYQLSDWEVEEAYQEHVTRGTTIANLAARYDVHKKTLGRAFMKLQTLRQRAFARELAPVAAQIEREETIMANDNTLGQLNIELFSELHRLREIDVADVAALDAEVKRSKAVEGIARMVIDNAKTVLSAAEMRAEYSKDATMPRMLEG